MGTWTVWKHQLGGSCLFKLGIKGIFPSHTNSLLMTGSNRFVKLLFELHATCSVIAILKCLLCWYLERLCSLYFVLTGKGFNSAHCDACFPRKSRLWSAMLWLLSWGIWGVNICYLIATNYNLLFPFIPAR